MPVALAIEYHSVGGGDAIAGVEDDVGCAKRAGGINADLTGPLSRAEGEIHPIVGEGTGRDVGDISQEQQAAGLHLRQQPNRRGRRAQAVGECRTVGGRPARSQRHLQHHAIGGQGAAIGLDAGRPTAAVVGHGDVDVSLRQDGSCTNWGWRPEQAGYEQGQCGHGEGRWLRAGLRHHLDRKAGSRLSQRSKDGRRGRAHHAQVVAGGRTFGPQ